MRSKTRVSTKLFYAKQFMKMDYREIRNLPLLWGPVAQCQTGGTVQSQDWWHSPYPGLVAQSKARTDGKVHSRDWWHCP